MKITFVFLPPLLRRDMPFSLYIHGRNICAVSRMCDMNIYQGTCFANDSEFDQEIVCFKSSQSQIL